MSRALNLFEEAHVIHALPPVNGTGGKASVAWKMANARGANILFLVGVSAAAFTKIFVYACDNAAKANPVAIPFKVYKEETAAGDTFGAATDVLATGYTPSANNDIMYGIYVDAQALASSGKGWMYVDATNGTNAVEMAAVVILTGTAFRASAHGVTAIA